eukprot:CAMPEP_0168618914 /NCGR_PEP_ID=MMETSP0449_2-20121227/6324_1 /TAXON_ID=1082188 /ORGANISM="Strombidium rassoulzadegani, Strain ras09" /LENGTH=263 /DNA_ID=CAMNT_0008659817 /DNA_START=117 /DNA_END=908 /DNA_ORIENTATION=+
MMNLLMRFYDVDDGEILLDGVNITNYNLHDLRKAISLVMQEPIIFNYTIFENILYGKIDATNSEIREASQIANCDEFILNNQIKELDDSAQALIKLMEENKDALTNMITQAKYDEEMEVLKKCKDQEEKKGNFRTQEGDVDSRPDSLKDGDLSKGFYINCGIKGGKLSGGQKQRVAIARTIIRKPKVLVLDEATSALDETNQKLVQEALDKAMEGRTTIIIAHRMSTIQNCNKIFVLEDGKVKEEGNFEELRQGDGYFAHKES